MESYEGALATLRQLLDDGVFREGQRLPPERVLAQKLDVGRRSLRRALGTLQGEGHILRQQGRGTFVAARNFGAAVATDRILENTNPLEVIELRLAMEPRMARLAAVRASRCDISRLNELADSTANAGDPAEYECADAAFHRRVAQAARNALFLSLYDVVSVNRTESSWQQLGENARCYKRQTTYAEFHRAIAAAIGERNAEKAEQLMYEHLSDVQRYVFDRAFPVASDGESRE